jgi:hypothetical protein
VAVLVLTLFVHILVFKFFRLSPNLAASYLIAFGFQKVSLLGSCIAFLLLGVTANRSDMRRIMEVLSTIDELLVRGASRNIYQEEFCTVLCQSVFLIGLAIGTLCYYVSRSSDFQNILFGVYYVVTLLINSVGLLQVLFLLQIIKLGFKRMGEELKLLEITSAVLDVPRVNRVKENPACRILALRSVHLTTHELAGMVNSCYGPLMLIETAHNFVSMVSLVDIVLILLDRRGDFAATVVYYACWLACYALKTTSLMLTSQKTGDESRKIVTTLHELLLRRKLLPCCERQLRLFLRQATDNRAVFTASGVFPLDLPTLHSIVSAAVTYSVVFGQMRQG